MDNTRLYFQESLISRKAWCCVASDVSQRFMANPVRQTSTSVSAGLVIGTSAIGIVSESALKMQPVHGSGAMGVSRSLPRLSRRAALRLGDRSPVLIAFMTTRRTRARDVRAVVDFYFRLGSYQTASMLLPSWSRTNAAKYPGE
jgi:hypothetical protein